MQSAINPTEHHAAHAIACEVCGQVHALEPIPVGCVARCVRCANRLAYHSPNSLARTGALALAALILYVPANLFPILQLELYGAHSDNTVWDGVHGFYQDGDYLMAGIVFLASIFIPVLKLLGLFFIVITTHFRMQRWKRFRTTLFLAIEGIGRWAMLDVFVLSIWVALVRLNALGSVSAGPGLLPFGCVVILTLLASASFDPQLIWQLKPKAS